MPETDPELKFPYMGRYINAIGMVLLLVVMVIVMLLTARSWKKVAPIAIEVTNPQSIQPASTPARPELLPGAGQLPRLNDMRRNTGIHTREIEELQDQIDE